MAILSCVAVDPAKSLKLFGGFSGKPLEFPKSESLKIQPYSSQVEQHCFETLEVIWHL